MDRTPDAQNDAAGDHGRAEHQQARRVLAWEVSNTLETAFCLRALRRAVEVTGRLPQIMNTDQGCPFTSEEWTGFLRLRGVWISMDGRGAWRDNVVVERFWRSIKYEDFYLRCDGGGEELRVGVGVYVERDNGRRPHEALGGARPDEAYAGDRSFADAA